jgi:hypothetical protein
METLKINYLSEKTPLLMKVKNFESAEKIVRRRNLHQIASAYCAGRRIAVAKYRKRVGRLKKERNLL